MGHTKIEIPNGLYGHKTDLKEQLRKVIKDDYNDRHAPNWLRGRRGQSVAEQLEDMVESAKRSAQRDHSDKDWRSLGFQFSWTTDTEMGTWTHTKGMSVGARTRGATAPDSIQEKCRNYDLDEVLKKTNQWAPPERASFTGFEIEVRVGPQGGIRDLALVADYKH